MSWSCPDCGWSFPFLGGDWVARLVTPLFSAGRQRPSAKALGSVQAIQQITLEETHVAATSSQALARLRAQEYVAVLIDQTFMETEPVESDMVLEHIGTAIPVHVNFAINGGPGRARVARCASPQQ